MKAELYKNVFKFFVKQSAETIARSENRRLFHARRAVTVNARSPCDECAVYCHTATVPNSADLSPARVCVAADGVISSIRYDGGYC